MKFTIFLTFLTGTFCLLTGHGCLATDKVMVYAAASTGNAVTEVAKAYSAKRGAVIKSSFAASSTLAKQIEAGAPAQVYISANPNWMDYLEEKGAILTDTRIDLLTNSLVLIAPRGAGFDVEMTPAFDLNQRLNGKLCLGDPDHVPVGIYAKEALQYLEWWSGLRSGIVPARDVRAVLTFVEMGECAAGIVYASDASLSDKIEILGDFPKRSHSPIVYPAAVIKPASASALAFIKYLQSTEAKQVFAHYGFSLSNE